MTPAQLHAADDDTVRSYLAGLAPAGMEAALAALDQFDLRHRERPIQMRDAAMWYVQVLGWPVFPLRPGDKRPLTDPANGFTNGFKGATLDAGRVYAAWTTAPEANIGTPTGSAETGGCGFDVLDVDRDQAKGINGYPAMADLQHAFCDFDCSCYPERPCKEQGQLEQVVWRALTPRGGMHLLFPARGSANGASLRPGLDVRGAGGYIALAPSLVNGKRYVWTKQPTRSET